MITMIAGDAISAGQIVHDYAPAVCIVVGFIIQALLLHGRRESEMQAMQEWTKGHQKEANQRDVAISELKQIAAAMKATAEGQDRRLELLEERKH